MAEESVENIKKIPQKTKKKQIKKPQKKLKKQQKKPQKKLKKQQKKQKKNEKTEKEQKKAEKAKKKAEKEQKESAHEPGNITEPNEPDNNTEPNEPENNTEPNEPENNTESNEPDLQLSDLEDLCEEEEDQYVNHVIQNGITYHIDIENDVFVTDDDGDDCHVGGGILKRKKLKLKNNYNRGLGDTIVII